MDLVAYVLREHAAVHARDVSGQAHPGQRVFDLDDDQMRARPGKGLNSLVWLLWHMARTEDVALSLVVAGRDQVLDEGWMRRMSAPWPIIGSGMTEDEVAELSARADVGAVRAYRSAVAMRTREVVRALAPEAWERILDAEDIARGGRAGAFRGWVEGRPYPWLGATCGDQIASSAVRHNAAHIGEAVTLRGLAGLGLGV